MGKTFHHHELLDLHAAGSGQTSEIVAGKIHEHHVLRPFLGIGKKFCSQSLVLRHACTASARSGNGRGKKSAVLAAHHDLGRRAEQRHARKTHEEHVRRGVLAAHAAVQTEGVFGERHAEPHGGNHLDGLSHAQHFPYVPHRCLKNGFGRFGIHVRLRRRSAAAPGKRSAAIHVPVTAETYLREPVVHMIEEQQRPGKAEHALRIFRLHDRGQLRMKKRRHAETEISAQ